MCRFRPNGKAATLNTPDGSIDRPLRRKTTDRRHCLLKDDGQNTKDNNDKHDSTDSIRSIVLFPLSFVPLPDNGLSGALGDLEF